MMIKICHQISTKVQNDRKLTVALFFSKPLYISRGESHFYGTEYEIWADFGPVGKGQLISKCLIGSIVSTKKPTKFF